MHVLTSHIYLAKRDVLSDLFCEIGVLSSCPDGNSSGTQEEATSNINTSSDVNNCGIVGNVCRSFSIGTTTCLFGLCLLTCPSGYTGSGLGCIDTQTDPESCGSLALSCPAGYAHGSGRIVLVSIPLFRRTHFC
ncbi:hypothetical protein JCM10213v2_000544 [Rhodosporidiobolus nylandii]